MPKLTPLLALIGAISAIWAAPTASATSRQGAAGAAVSDNMITVGGKPFFPIMAIDQCSTDGVARARALGINVILNENCPGTPASDQLAHLGDTQLGVVPIEARGTADGQLMGWTFPDEPESNGWTPASLAKRFPRARGVDDGVVSFITTTSAFFRAPFRDPKVPYATTVGFAHLADIAGFDLYPLNHCQHDLSTVYDAQRQFSQLVGRQPTFQWIETGPLVPSYCGGFTMTSAQLTAETWLAITGGARGVGFFTHTFGANGSPLDLTPGIEHAMRRFTSLASAVMPGLAGLDVASTVNSPAVKAVARRANGRVYVFAVNSLSTPVRAQVYVPALAPGTLTVFGEKRSLSVASHRFVETFKPLAVHVYVQRD
jgi:hypothetical protein